MPGPQIITLLTDFGYHDAYVGIMKGVIFGVNPRVNIIDICHDIPPQDILSGAYLLYTAYKYFPAGTIHVAVIDPGVGSERDIVCAKVDSYIFLAPDNGLLSFIVSERIPEEIINVTNSKFFLPSPSSTFHGRDIFAPVAAHLSSGVKLHQLGAKCKDIKRIDIPAPGYKKTGRLEGQIIYIDRFGNLITNILRDDVAKFFNNRLSPHLQKKTKITKNTYGGLPFFNLTKVVTTVKEKRLTGIKNTYTDVKPGRPLVLFGSAGFLEISINQGNAQKHFQANRGDKVYIKAI